MVVSSCIGSGVFALTGQLANVASPGAALVAWLVCGLGFLFLALALACVGSKRPELDGVCAYAEEGFGPFHGFISGWGYWLSAWLGNVGFATMIAQVLGSKYCLGGLLPGVFSNPQTGNPAVVERSRHGRQVRRHPSLHRLRRRELQRRRLHRRLLRHRAAQRSDHGR